MGCKHRLEMRMQTYRTLGVIQQSGQIVLSNLPFRPGQLVEVFVLGEDQYRSGLTEKLALLLKETQALPQVQSLTEAEIAAYRSGQ
jgi:hypothetical protein